MDLDKVDLMTEIDSLRRGWQACEARLATVEAERDAATKKAEQLLLSRYFTRCREGAFDHSTDCATWGDDGQGNVDGKPVHPPCNCGASWNWAKQMEAERDAARAEAARAVAVLRAVVAGAYPHEEEIWTMEGAVLRRVHRVLDRYEPTLDNQPSALDWLAQQRREALEQLEAMKSTSSAMLPKSASVSEEGGC